MAGQLIARGPNRWKLVVFLGRDTNGKRRFFTKTFHCNKKTAQSHLRQLLHEKDLGQLASDADSGTVDEYLDKWLETAAGPRLRARTLYEYTQLLKRYARPRIGPRKLTSLTPLDVQSLYTRMLEKGLSARTIRYLHSVLSSALKQAVKWRLLSQNPAAFVDLPKQQPNEMICLDDSQSQAFLQEAKGKSCEPMLALALLTGMRPGEYLGLKWTDLDLQNGTVTVQRSLSRHKTDWHFEQPKTRKSRRSIPIPAEVVTLLSEHKRKQAQHKIEHADTYQDHGLVFATRSGLPYSTRNVIDDFFKPILEAAELPNKIRLYDLRHTCATLLLLQGVHPKVVSERLGHASVTLTLDTYSHVLPTMQREATEKLRSLLFKPNQSDDADPV